MEQGIRMLPRFTYCIRSEKHITYTVIENSAKITHSAFYSQSIILSLMTDMDNVKYIYNIIGSEYICIHIGIRTYSIQWNPAIRTPQK